MTKLRWQGAWLTAAGKVRGRRYQLQVELVHEVMQMTPAGAAYVRAPMREVLPANAPLLQAFRENVQKVVQAVRQALCTRMSNAEVFHLFETQCDAFLHTGRQLLLTGQPPLIGEAA